jgi:hypothetical protein
MPEMSNNVVGGDTADNADRDKNKSDHSGIIKLDTVCTPFENAWWEFGIKESQRSTEICRDTGKTALQIVGLLLPGYLAALVAIFKDSIPAMPSILAAPCLFWLGSMVVDIFVILPWSWNTNDEDPYKIKHIYEKISERKKRLLLAVIVLLIVGIASLGFVLLVYWNKGY